MSEYQDHSTAIDAFKTAFVETRRRLIDEHGPSAFDMGHALYICPKTGKSIVVTDSFLLSEGNGPVNEFIADVGATWWSERSAFEPKSEAGQPTAVCGIYGHYLPGSGFDWLMEFKADGSAPEFWRADAAGRLTPLDFPEDEGTFRDQTGSFFDLRSGWRWLAATHLQDSELLVREVEAGYLVGARKGVPGDPDPASREDPALAHAFSRWDTQDYDVLEFLASTESESYPFHGERCNEWLGEHTAAVVAGEVELFALAHSRNFFEAILEVCQQRDLSAQWPDRDPEGSLSIVRDEVRIDLHFAYVFLRTLHTGRTFAEGIRAFVQPTIDLVEEAADLCLFLRNRLSGHVVNVVDGMTLEILVEENEEPVGRWSMVNLVGRSNLRGASGQETILKLLGFNPQTGQFDPRPFNADVCPVCDAAAHLGKSIRPLAHLGNDPRTLAGVITQDHVIYFTINCPEHSTPILLEPGVGLADLEEKYRERLDEAQFELLVFEALNEDATARLAIGFDAGSLILEPSRIRALLEATQLSTEGSKHLYGLFPDALVISETALDGEVLHGARLAAHEAIGQLFPGRTWPLDVNRTVELDEPATGNVNWRR